jgi:hypothetical protein
MFATVGIPFAEYRSLPRSEYRWLLICLSRYADEAGVAFPTMRQLAIDSGFSLASVSRYLATMEDLGVFQRDRLRGGGRYRYVIAGSYRPQRFGRVSALKTRVSQCETREAKSFKQARKEGDSPDLPREAPWEQRVRGYREGHFWLPQWGAKPGETGCLVPAALLQTVLRPDG